MLKKDIAKWLTIEKNNSSNTSNDEDFKGHHEHLLLELENQYQNKERLVIQCAYIIQMIFKTAVLLKFDYIKFFIKF